jgi:hypothetical protein
LRDSIRELRLTLGPLGSHKVSAVATEFAPISATTWRAQVQNQTIVSTTVKLYALCLSFT